MSSHMSVSSIAVAAVLMMASSAAQADPVTATLLAQYYQVADRTDLDFPGATPTVAASSVLGPNGLPIGTGSNDINPITSEITWWSPALNPHVQFTGSANVTLPYSSNMYAPNSTGSDDSSFFETAVFTGNFTLASASTVDFDLGSDDDSFIYIDGVLFGQNPGIHGVTTVDFTTPTLSAGTHQLKVFYADRQNTGAFLSLSLDAKSSGIVITPPAVPEPATWAMFIGGFGLIGGAMRRRQSAREALA